MNRCKICVMPEVEGHIHLDENGVCQLCKAEKETQNTQETKNVDQLIKKIKKYKSEDSKYDCVVSISGGKDSIMTLYIAKKVLNLNPLAVFIDNGFSCDEMYENVRNATDILKVDLQIHKTSEVKELFKHLLIQREPIYYCRICHALIDIYLRDICEKNNITLVLGGYTKGQNYLKSFELHWINKISDENTKKILSTHEKYGYIAGIFPNIPAYLLKNFKPIVQVSPFWYMKWDEDEILERITNELRFTLPKKSWPKRSTNCMFNYVSQHLALKHFGYSQHETENSELVRCGEIDRHTALDIINTPITEEDLKHVLGMLDLKLSDI